MTANQVGLIDLLGNLCPRCPKKRLWGRPPGAPVVTRVRHSDRRTVVASLDGVRQTGTLPGIAFTLDPDESPVIFRDVGVQEIYSLVWKAH